jgi:MFS transporter, PAT family, beta-lactamase induction signal transducer AmpG
MLSRDQRCLANGLQVAGYRVGMIVGGGMLLILLGRLGTSSTFLVMAGLVALASVPVLFAREDRTSGCAVPRHVTSMPHFLRRPGVGQILTLVVAYKLGDAFATGMLRPFFADAGLGLTEIGWLLGTVGFVAGLVGALLGGCLVNRLGRRRSLLAFGAFQAIAVASYTYLAAGAPRAIELYVVCGIEHLAGGMATAALFTCMMDWSSPHSGATDYTVQASAVVIATGAASALAGFSAQVLGYAGHFVLASLLSVLTLFVVARCFPESSSLPWLGAFDRVDEDLTGGETCQTSRATERPIADLDPTV